MFGRLKGYVLTIRRRQAEKEFDECKSWKEETEGLLERLRASTERTFYTILASPIAALHVDCIMRNAMRGTSFRKSG